VNTKVKGEFFAEEKKSKKSTSPRQPEAYSFIQNSSGVPIHSHLLEDLAPYLDNPAFLGSLKIKKMIY
jgi:hypothetical protein